MKKLLIILLILPILISCSDDDDFNPVEGSWESARGIITFTSDFKLIFTSGGKVVDETIYRIDKEKIYFDEETSIYYREHYYKIDYKLQGTENEYAILTIYKEKHPGGSDTEYRKIG